MATTSSRSSKDYTPRHARSNGRGKAGQRPDAGRRGRGPTRKKDPKTKRGFFRRFWWAFVLAPFVVGFFGVAALAIAYVRIDLPRALPPIQTTFVYDRNGTLLSSLHGSVDRTLIPLSQMPEHLRDAVVAVEDARFYEHSGFDLKGTMRAAWQDLVRHGAVQGGSTITQQLVKRIYAGHYVKGEDGVSDYVVPSRTVKEKVREVLLAMKVERTMSKDKILAKYLNTVYFGHGAYGIEAAARTYFGIEAKRLTVLQSAVLAGILTAPEAYDPIDHPFDAKFRRDFALERMVRYGYLDAAEADRLEAKPCCGIPMRLAGGQDRQLSSPGASEYFVQFTKEELIRKYGSAAVFGGGLQVRTTLDLRLQRAAEASIASHLPTPGDPSAALVALDPTNGQILAMDGGTDFAKSQLNLATFKGGTGRQAGSAFKLFTLAAAMEKGISLDSFWYGPNTLTIDDPACNGPDGPWQPENAEGGGGSYSLKAATAYSVNTVFAQLIADLGPSTVVDMAHRLGIRSKLPDVCAITLGSVAVNPLEMTNGYATIADQGLRHRPTPLLQVRSSGGRIDGSVVQKGKQVVDPNVANLVTYALQGVVDYGTGHSANLTSWPTAGKTGTAQDNVDAWFCGFTEQIAACVWVGYPQGQIPLENIEGVPSVFGGTIPAAIWHDFMTVAMEGKPAKSFPVPSFAGQTVTPSAIPPPPPPSPSPSPSPKPSPSPSPSPEPSPSPPPSPSESPSPTAAPQRPTRR